jgi:hypothetical protein
MLHNFCFRDCCVLFCVLSNPVEDLIFTILVEARMLSSLPALVQSMHQSRLDRESRTVECFRHRIDGDSYIGTPFCYIPHLCSLRESKFESSETRVPSKNLQTLPGKQNSSKRDKVRSMGRAGAQAGSADVFAPPI